MFHRVTVHASDPEASERFYDLVLATLGIERTAAGDGHAAWGDFAVAPATDDRPVTRRLHIGFVAPSREHADAFWRAGVGAGHPDDGAPGPRPQYRPDYYGAFLLDPDGNSAEAVHHGALRTGGVIDHLWLRVADVEASTRFYAAVAPRAGLEAVRHSPQHTQLKGTTGSFSVVAGDAVTEHAQLELEAAGDGAARGGERDPDGNTVDVV
jgi:catechol 2,3-dioxygenase-like lactoylglutathione lyase family enzyme